MNNTPFCDLHSHTLHSDGELRPEALVDLAASRGVQVLALTDHDTLAGIPAAHARARQLGIELIPGIEISVGFGRSDLHLLGYFIRKPAVLSEALVDLRTSRVQRAHAMLARLADLGCPVAFEAVEKRARGGIIGRPHVAEELVEQGFVSSFNDAFELYLGNGKPAYVARTTLTLSEASQLLRSAGAVPVLAHPGVNDCDDQFEAIAADGVLGLEVWHPAHDPATTARYLEQADRLGLVPTGGSDFHRQIPGGILPGDIGLTSERLEVLRSLAG